MLLGQIFDFSTGIGVGGAKPGMDLPFELALPTYAATAWYHKKLSPQPPALEPFLKEVEDFALGEYMHALAEGTDLSDAEKHSVAEKLHDYTGLPGGLSDQSQSAREGGEFDKTFADDQDMTAGRYDSRFLGPTLDPLSEAAEYDPQSAAISSAYFSLLNVYLRHDLKYGAGETYMPERAFRWHSPGI